TWADVDFGACRVHVRRRWYRGAFGPPKSRFGRRAVPITEAMGQRLWAVRAERRARDDQYVFVSEKGRMVDASNLMSRVLKPAARAAGVPWLGFHSLRHFCATELFRRGLNAKQAQMWLGHHSPAFTLATYVHLLPDDMPDSPFGSPVVGRDAPQVGNRWATEATETGRNVAALSVAK
ncbi:MAG TPA: tyrosine-type recombinase/integrase, partial [Gaiellaceae bacterium]|nr:tyrosine-type recombinase/integrase [Gaiellaceae bacterium]